MVDYAKGVNLKYDVVSDKIYVSTAKFPCKYFGGYLYETWIFNKNEGQNSKQIFHKSEKKSIIAHNHIVNNLKKKLRNIKGA